jgi:hypothetical protein
VSLSTVCFHISKLTVGLMTLGWVAVLYTATFMKGGHPPMSAFVGMIVIVSSWILGTLGSLCSLAAVGQQRSAVRLLFLGLNAALLGFSVIVNFV